MFGTGSSPAVSKIEAAKLIAASTNDVLSEIETFMKSIDPKISELYIPKGESRAPQDLKARK